MIGLLKRSLAQKDWPTNVTYLYLFLKHLPKKMLTSTHSVSWIQPSAAILTDTLKWNLIFEGFRKLRRSYENSCSYCFAERWSHTRLKMTQISTACPLFDEYDAQFKWEVSWQGQFWQHAQFSETFPIWRSMLCRWVAQSRTSMITYSSSLWISCRNPYLPAKLSTN